MTEKKYLTDEEVLNDPNLLTYVAIGSHPFLLFYDVNDYKIKFCTADDANTYIEIPKQALMSLGRVVTQLGERFTT